MSMCAQKSSHLDLLQQILFRSARESAAEEKEWRAHDERKQQEHQDTDHQGRNNDEKKHGDYGHQRFVGVGDLNTSGSIENFPSGNVQKGTPTSALADS